MRRGVGDALDNDYAAPDNELVALDNKHVGLRSRKLLSTQTDVLVASRNVGVVGINLFVARGVASRFVDG